MNNSQNSVSQRFIISANSSNRGKLQNQTKFEDHVIVITNATSQSLYTTSILMIVGHQRTGRKTSEGLHRKEIQGLSIKDSPIQPKRQSFKPWLGVRPRPIYNETSILHVP
jgi:hypothetical protein